ncbi:hypothetical protein DEO72_LG3g1643 [Vigna unguiculata]|uniref:Uncharacterized protein n=1 Tax=Vigna unguiculata TaxID=3917 RepID=A0A4D6LER9_VIGUN|nr:hypothetical protein DEO72_LG3g1643 [Vigna unguiculata]
MAFHDSQWVVGSRVTPYNYFTLEHGTGTKIRGSTFGCCGTRCSSNIKVVVHATRIDAKPCLSPRNFLEGCC